MTLKALLIGEAKGKTEEEYNYGFIGTSGQELVRMGGESELFPPLLKKCQHCGLIVSFGRCSNCGIYNNVSPLEMIKFWTQTKNYGIGITNVFQAHPEKDNIELFFGNKDEDINLTYGPYKRKNKNFYVKNEFKHHLERLFDEINTLKPNLLILLGNTACWAVLGQVKISELRGTITDTKFGIKALPTYHPAALYHNSGGGGAWTLRPIIVSDLKKAKTEAENFGIQKNKMWLLINPTLEEIESWFSIPSQRRICDIESGFVLYSDSELEQMKKYAPKARRILARLISMVGFSRDEENGLVIPFLYRDEQTGELKRYWPTLNHEVQAWQWVQYGLSNTPELGFQNGMYDVNRLVLSGMRPKNMIHDSMLLHHSMLPEMRKGLGFLNGLYGDFPAWKTMYGTGTSLKRDD